MNYLIFDAETESTNLTLSRPWQIACVLCDEKNIIESHDIHIDIPDLNISKDAKRITGFNQKIYDKKKIPIKEACKQIESLMFADQTILVGHNILGFDIYQIRNLFRLIGKDFGWDWLYRCVDTHCLARGLAYNSKPPKDQPDFLIWSYKMLHRVERGVKSSISYLAGEYEIPFDQSRLHDALYDITINFEIFKKIKYEMELDFSSWVTNL